MLCFLSSPVWWRPLLRTARRCEDPVATWSSLAFLLALTWLFGASASYHLGPWTLEQEMVAAKLDFLGIALVISYNVCPMFSLRMKDAASRNALLVALSCLAAATSASQGGKRVLHCHFQVLSRLSQIDTRVRQTTWSRIRKNSRGEMT